MLITAAPVLTAASIASPDAAQVISPSVPGMVDRGTLTARALGHTPRTAIPFNGAAATEAVAVPCSLVTAWPGSVEKKRSPVHSGWVTSAAASTSAISGEVSVTGGGATVGATTFLRQSLGAEDSGSSGTAWSCLRMTFAWA